MSAEPVSTRFNKALPAVIQAQLLSDYGDIGKKALIELNRLLRTTGFLPPSAAESDGHKKDATLRQRIGRLLRLLRIAKHQKLLLTMHIRAQLARGMLALALATPSCACTDEEAMLLPDSEPELLPLWQRTRLLAATCDLINSRWMGGTLCMELLTQTDNDHAPRPQITWRDMQRALHHHFLRRAPSTRPCGQHVLGMHLHMLIRAAKAVRRSWGGAEAAEMADEMVPCLRQTHSTTAFEAQATLCLLMPRPNFCDLTSTDYVASWGAHVRGWFAAWEEIDRCAEWDCGWLRLLGRIAMAELRAGIAGKAVDWAKNLSCIIGRVRQLLQLPSVSGDRGVPARAWPRASAAVMCVRASGPEKGARLLVLLLGMQFAPAKDETPCAVVTHILQLLVQARTLLHPAAARGAWTGPLSRFVSSLCYQLAKRVGAASTAASSYPGWKLRAVDAMLLREALLPLVFDGLYARQRNVQESSQQALAALAPLAPVAVTAKFLPRALNALAVTNLEQVHQAPAILRVLQALVVPLLRGSSALAVLDDSGDSDTEQRGPLLAPWLPLLLPLTLQGIDPNDTSKTLLTLHLCFTLLQWLPLIDCCSGDEMDSEGSRPHFVAIASADPEDSAQDMFRAAFQAGPALEKWSLQLLDRLLKLIDALAPSGVIESNGDADSDAEDTSSGHHVGGIENWVRAGANGALACLFSQMSPSLHRRATARVRTFMVDECRPETTKSAAAVIAALVATSVVDSDSTAVPPAQSALLPSLLHTLFSAAAGGGWQLSADLDKRTLCSKLRLLDGFIRGSCGAGIALSSDAESSSEPSLFTALRAAVRGALAHTDKRVHAIGCKLLRHALQRLLHTYPVEARCAAPSKWRAFCSSSSGAWPYHAWGAASTWENLGVAWHLAGCDKGEFTHEMACAAELLDEFLVGSGTHAGVGQIAGDTQASMRILQDLVLSSDTAAVTDTAKPADHATKERWLQALRQLHHVLRGVLVALPMVDRDKSDAFSRFVSPLRAKIADLLSSVLRSLFRQSHGEEDRDNAKDSVSTEGASLPLWITRPVSIALQCAELVLCDHGLRGYRSMQRQWGFLYSKQLIKKDNLVAWASTAPLHAELGRVSALLQDALTDVSAENAAWSTYNGLGTPLHPRLMLVCRAAHQRERLLAQREWNAPRRLRSLAMQTEHSSSEGSSLPDIYDSDDDDSVGMDTVMDHETDADVMVSSPTTRIDWSARLASYERLVDVVAASASASQYDAVRSQSLASISHVLNSWGWLRARLLWRQLRVLSAVVTQSQVSPSAEAIMAAAELLRNGNSVKWIASRPEAAKKLTMALCNCDQLLRALPAHKQQNAQSTLFQIFAGWGMEWSPCVPQPVTQHNARPEHPTAPLVALIELLEGSIGGDKGRTQLHWRYIVTATAWLLLHQTESLTTSGGACQPLLPHCTLPTDLQRRLWRWFARCAFGSADAGTNEKLSTSSQGSESSATPFILPLQQVALTGLEVLSEQTLLLEQELANTRGRPDPALAPPRELYAWLQTQFVANALLRAGTANHLAQAEDSAGADASQVRGAGISSFFARQSGSMWSTNVSQALSALRLRTAASFPSSRHAMPKSNVVFRHVAVVERLALLAAFSEHEKTSQISSLQLDAWVAVIGDALEISQGTEAVVAGLESAAVTEQERMARRAAAAECFAGFLSACICSDAAAGPNSADATSRLLPIIVHAVTSSTLNDVNDWVVALRIAVTGYAIKHPPTQYGSQCIAALCDTIENNVQASLATMHSGGSGPVEAFASQLKWLRVFKAMLMETECRVASDVDVTAVPEASDTLGVVDEAAAALARGGRAQGRCGSVATWRSIINAAAHPYSVCRQELAQCLALGINRCPIIDGNAATCIRTAVLVARAVVLDTASAEERALGAVPRSARHVLRLHRAQAYAQTASAESLDPCSHFIAKEESETVARRTETAMYLCLQTIGTCDRIHFGAINGSSFISLLLPTMLSGHAHPVPEVELVARAATTTCAQSLKLPEWSSHLSESDVVGDLRQLMKRSGTIAQVSCSWRVRLAALRFTAALALRNAHILLPRLTESTQDTRDRVAEAVDGAISDLKSSYSLSASVRRQALANETAIPLENCTEWGGDEDACAPIALGSGCLLRWVLTLCFSALSDAQPEVCEEARLSLSGFCVGFMHSATDCISATDDDKVDHAAEADGVVQSSPALRMYVERFITLAQEGGSAKTQRKIKRLQSAVDSAADDVAKAAASKKLESNIAKAKWKETTGVLALAAAVTAFPHHLPLVLPAALAQLASHGSSRNPIARECAKQTTSRFKASHSENWTALKRFFSTDQLESLEGDLFALSYFA